MQFSCSLPISLPRCGDYCVPGDAPTSGICGAWDRQDRCRVSWVCGRHSAQCLCVENTEWGASWTSPTDSLDLKTQWLIDLVVVVTEVILLALART